MSLEPRLKSSTSTFSAVFAFRLLSRENTCASVPMTAPPMVSSEMIWSVPDSAARSSSGFVIWEKPSAAEVKRLRVAESRELTLFQR